MKYTVVPSAWNFTMCFFMKFINDSKKLKYGYKAVLIIWCIVKICASVSVVHANYIPTQCIFVCGIIASAFFNKTKYIIYATIDSVFMLILSIILAEHFNNNYSFNEKVEYSIISFFILIAACLLSHTIILDNNRSNNVINNYVVELERALHNSKLDMMTGLYNHAEFYNILYNYTFKCVGSIVVVIMDIDHFKQINDVYGHSNGDKVILKIADLAKQISNDKNVFSSRYGGEEFAFIFIDTDVHDVVSSINKLRNDISSFSFDFDKYKKITISAGVFYCNPREYTVSDMFNNADAALYYSKEHGRNRLTIFDEMKKGESS